MDSPINLQVQTLPLSWLPGTSQERSQALEIFGRNWNKLRLHVETEQTQVVCPLQSLRLSDPVSRTQTTDNVRSGRASEFPLDSVLNHSE
jgi:hypothetical protein